MKLSLGGGVLAVVAALLLAPGAAAKPREFTLPPSQEIEFGARASNGYKLLVLALSEANESLVGARFSKGAAAVSYIKEVGRNADDQRFKVRLPGIGRVNVAFQPHGKADREGPYTGCRGRGSSTQRGIFVGTIRLRGEHGFTEVDRTRARGAVTRNFRQTCKEGEKRAPDKGGGKMPAIEETELTVSGQRAGGSLFFSASRPDGAGTPEPFRSVVYLAGLSELRQGMVVQRVAAVEGGPRTLTATPEAPGVAVATPPAPFTGTGNFSLAADGSALWTGDLSIELPGIDPLLLTGKSLSAELCFNDKCVGDALGESSRG